MASQMAQILTNFGNNTASKSGEGINQGVKGYIAAKQAGDNAALKRSKTSQDQVEYEQGQEDRREEKLFGLFSAIKTPDQLTEAQNNGLAPKEIKWEDREPFLMSVMAKHALKSGAVNATA